eukprot:2580447-Amphidinium_carterae.2
MPVWIGLPTLAGAAASQCPEDSRRTSELPSKFQHAGGSKKSRALQCEDNHAVFVLGLPLCNLFHGYLSTVSNLLQLAAEI